MNDEDRGLPPFKKDDYSDDESIYLESSEQLEDERQHKKDRKLLSELFLNSFRA